MLKSSNLESIIGAVAAEEHASSAARTNATQQLPSLNNNNNNATAIATTATTVPTITYTSNTRLPHDVANNNVSESRSSSSSSRGAATAADHVALTASASTPSLASLQLTAGLLQIFEPPLVKARGQLKELIGKQNKIYIDLSAEKFKLDNAEIAKLHEMMNNVKIYREKLIKIKKQMQNIYQRTKVLKKRAVNVQTCKQRELQRKLQKQQQEESLIGKQQQQQQQQQQQPPQPQQ